jgi:hypothetical protein
MRRLIVVAVLGACGGTTAPAQERCDPPTLPRRAFRTIAARLGDPHHVAGDAVVAVGAPFTITASFTYGKLRKDLEGEDVALVLGEGACGPWEPAIDGVTDDEGWARFARPAFDRPVVRTFHVVVYGDGTRVDGGVWAVVPGTGAVLFDVDGTLTTDDGELFEDLLGGSANMRAGADAVARRWAELGYVVVYITGRPRALGPSTRRWLDAHGFPRGPVITPDDVRDIVPSREHVGAFKRATITTLTETGLVFEAAYGNAATDVCAYAEAGIAPDHTWITQPRGPCDAFDAPHDLPSYVEHLPTLADHVRAPD